VHLSNNKTVRFLEVKLNIIIRSEKLLDLSQGKTLKIALK